MKNADFSDTESLIQLHNVDHDDYQNLEVRVAKKSEFIILENLSSY